MDPNPFLKVPLSHRHGHRTGGRNSPVEIDEFCDTHASDSCRFQNGNRTITVIALQWVLSLWMLGTQVLNCGRDCISRTPALGNEENHCILKPRPPETMWSTVFCHSWCWRRTVVDLAARAAWVTSEGLDLQVLRSRTKDCLSTAFMYRTKSVCSGNTNTGRREATN